jgi:hypothetical protein
MNATFLGFKWVYIKKFNPIIPNSFATMKSHEFHSKAYWMTVTTLTLGSQPRQGLARVRAKREARKSHLMLPGV